MAQQPPTFRAKAVIGALTVNRRSRFKGQAGNQLEAGKCVCICHGPTAARNMKKTVNMLMMVPDERSLAYPKPSDLFVELVLEAWNFRDLSPSTHNPSYCSFVDAWTFHFSTFYTHPLFPLL
jgi:hypothetical protein